MGTLSNFAWADPGHVFIPRERNDSDLAHTPAQDKELLTTAQHLQGQANVMQPLVRARLAELADPSKLVNRAYGTANADVSQRTGSLGAMTPFQRAMSKSGALSKIGLMGKNQVLQQNFRDRVGMVRFGQGLLTNNVRDLTTMSQQQGESDAAMMRARQVSEASNANMVGTLGGGLASMFSRNQNSEIGRGWKGSPMNTNMIMDTPRMNPGGGYNA